MRDIRCGLVARADNTGLGIQTLDFAKHMKPCKSLIVDLSHLNGLTTHFERYPGAEILKHSPYPDSTRNHPEAIPIINNFLDGLDLVFTCETPYDYHLFSEARRRGIRTILQYNFELLDHLINPGAPQPDLFMAPSSWRYQEVNFPNKIFIPVPVDTERFPYQHRTSANTFLHLAGNATVEDRNGTGSLIESWKKVNPIANLLIQSPRLISHSNKSNIQINYTSTTDNTDLYRTGDVFVMPRKYGGLCLPLNEALALGMPVIMTDLPPQNEFLPASTLVSAIFKRKIFTKTNIDVYEVDQQKLAHKINELIDNPKMISCLSEYSGEIAQSISWKRLASTYREIFEAVMDNDVPPAFFTWLSPKPC